MTGPVMERVSSLVSRDIASYLTNQQTWGGILINVMDKAYGAKGNDSADDGPAIRRALATLTSSGGGILYFPPGYTFACSLVSYLTGRQSVIRLPDNIKVEMTGSTIKLLSSVVDTSYDIIGVYNSVNCRVEGGTLIGNKHTSPAVTGESGMGIGLYGASNFSANGTTMKSCWGDGMYVGRAFAVQAYCKNVVLTNVTCDDNRRQGMSIISCKNLLAVNFSATSTSGTSPQCGIDIEPNGADEFLENIELMNITTSNNVGSGIQIYLANIDSTSAPVSITITNHTDRSTVGDTSFRVRRINKQTKGFILAKSCVWENSGARVVSHDENVASGIKTTLEDCLFGYNGTNLAFPIIDGRANRSGGAVSPDPLDPDTSTVGNLHVIRPKIYSLNGVLTTNAAMYVRGYPTFSYSTFSLIDPVGIQVDVTSGRLNALYVDGDATGIALHDYNGILSYAASASVITTSSIRTLKQIENTSTTTTRGCDISGWGAIVGLEFTLRIAAADGEINPGASGTIRGFTIGQVIIPNTARTFSVITMRVRATNSFEIISSSCDWKLKP